MDYLTVALILIGLGAFLLVAEVLAPTGGILVVAALLFFALGVGTILMYSDSLLEAVVAIMGLAVGLPVAAFATTAAWRRMSLDTALDDAGSTLVVAPEVSVLKGRTGKTVSPMRPSGTVEFDGKRVDAMTEGTMLDAGVWVRCVDVKRGQVLVREIEEPTDVTGIDPQGIASPVPEPKDNPSAGEEPQKDEPKKPRDDFDDFDIGLDKT